MTNDMLDNCAAMVGKLQSAAAPTIIMKGDLGVVYGPVRHGLVVVLASAVHILKLVRYRED